MSPQIEPKKVAIPEPPTVSVHVKENGQVEITTQEKERDNEGDT